MIFDRVALKARAREAIGSTNPSPYVTALVYCIILYVLNLLNTKLTGINLDYYQLQSVLESGNYNALIDMVSNSAPSATNTAVGILIQLMTTMLGVGFTISMLHVYRRQEASVGNLFDGFANFLNILWLEILIWLFTLLWTLLFIVPGFVASYSYRQAIYLLLDDPQKRPIDCIRESKQMMRGRKGELFILDLSFLGWVLLTIIPFVAIYVSPYLNVTYAGYYCMLTNTHTGGEVTGEAPAPWDPDHTGRGYDSSNDDKPNPHSGEED